MKKCAIQIFIMGGIVGALLFVCLYGFNVLNIMVIVS